MEVAATKLKKRIKIIRIANNADADWSQVLYEMYFLGSNSDNYCKVCQAEARVKEKRSIKEHKSHHYQLSETQKSS